MEQVRVVLGMIPQEHVVASSILQELVVVLGRVVLCSITTHCLCDELDPIIGCQQASGLSTERKVLCALRFFGTGSFQRSVGCEEQIGMAQPAASNTIQDVTEAIISVSARRKLVDFSLTPAAKDEAKAAFARRCAIPGVLACVDGTLVAIMKPEGLSPADTASFMSRKGYYALNVMVVSTVGMFYFKL
ncbi:hypothetical protein HPB49_006873 [Dermacentor silvarum]|uniref:Uncharacterized protein n=1 Tax=Dermacentor silvarum TaxID=543639 RepID=A0ACB8DIF5_DERSI|nr:hypothetical protein HPB49_006873 [Dermacentor silvarum]